MITSDNSLLTAAGTLLASTSQNVTDYVKPEVFDKCSFCQADSSKTSATKLQPCLFCGKVAYCSMEHQQLHWSVHKATCQALQFKGMVKNHPPLEKEINLKTPATGTVPSPTFSITAQRQSSSSSSNVPSFIAGTSTSAFQPYKSTVSCESVPSFAMLRSEETSAETKPAFIPRFNSEKQVVLKEKIVPVQVVTAANLVKMRKGVPTKETIIPTGDPDIQIIESDATSKPSRLRKRPTPTNSTEPKISYKDHNMNLVYSTTLQEHQRHLQNRGLALNIHQAMVLRLRYIAEHVIRSLNEFGWAVVDNFLGSDHYKYTSLEIERLYKRGLFSAGQLMEGKNKDEFHITDIRSDQIYWYDGSDKRANDAATVRLLISMIDSVIQHFKKRIDHEIGGRSRAMLAIYPGSGTRYVKHVDNPVKDGRCITTIYYCNEDWDMSRDGGTLRLYPETSMTPMDIDPRADRLVFFWSDRRNPHEVMPVYRHRFAITIWYMDKNERDRALAKSKEVPAEKREGVKTSSPDSALGTPTHPRKNPSTHDLANLDLRMFSSTSSDPALASSVPENEKMDSSDLHSSSSNSVVHPDSVTDSGIFLSQSDNNQATVRSMERISSLQSISDAFKSERSNDRPWSNESDVDVEDSGPLPPAPPDNPEYII